MLVRNETFRSGGAVAFGEDTITNYGPQTFTSTFSMSHTLGANANAIIVALPLWRAGATLNVDIAGVDNFTQEAYAEEATNVHTSSVWSIHGTPVTSRAPGSITINVTSGYTPSGNRGAATAISFNNASSTFIQPENANGFTSGQISINPTTLPATYEYWAAGFYNESGATGQTLGGVDGTEINSALDSSQRGFATGYISNGSASETITWEFSGGSGGGNLVLTGVGAQPA